MPYETYREFESLIADLLSQRGFANVEREARVSLGGHVREIDVLAEEPGDKVVPVEVKLVGGPRLDLRRLREMSVQTANLHPHAKGSPPLLVTASCVNAAHREWAESEFRIEIWDRNDILQRAGTLQPKFEQLFDKLDRAYEKSARSSRLGVGTAISEALAMISESPLAAAEPTGKPRGEDLIRRLEAIHPGQEEAKNYEATCQDIIDYVFGEDLRDGRSQLRTEDGLNIYDMIYRVRPVHPFWATLTRDFRARVVLFECKNYSGPISPMQVFTSERYLSASAMRPICFLLSRSEPHAHAVQAAFGAMRESGKLLIFLSDSDLVQLIRAKDAQLDAKGDKSEMLANDPTELLDQKIYNFIAGMPR